ncbi:MAG: lipopolysaccharide biosynthesis protein [Vicinamibacterales bacterium]
MSTVIRNVVSNWAGVAVNLVVAFLLSPFLVHSLGDRAYGLWVLVLSVTGYMGLLDTGLRVAIVKHTAEFNASKDTAGLNRTLFTGLTLYSSLSVIVMLLAVGASFLFERLFAVTGDEAAVGRTLVLIAGLNVALSLPLGVLGGLLSGLQRFDLLNRATVIVLLARTALVVAAIKLGFGLIALGWIHILAQLLTGAVLAVYSRQQFPELDLRPKPPEWSAVKALYQYGGYIVLNNVAMFLLFYSGEVLIGMFVGTQAVTPYAIARSLVQYLSTIIGAMTQVFHPYASDQNRRGNTSAVSDALIIGTKTSLLIALPIGGAYLIVGPTFIDIWMGQGYGRSAGLLLALLTIPQIVWLSQSTAGNILLGVDRHRFITMLNLGTGIVGIALGATLAPRFGAVGVTIGMGVPVLISQALVLPLVTARTLRLPFGSYVAGGYVGPILASVPFAIALLGFSRTWPARNLVTFALQVVASLAVFVPAVYFLAFNRSERALWLSRLRPSRTLASEAS